MELGTIKLTKVDKANSETKLKGAVFELYKQGEQSYDENGEPIDFSGEPVRESDTRYPNSSTVYTTDGNGEIVVPDVEWGTYYFKEITPPEGYELPQNAVTDTITINPSTGNDSGEITVQNEKIFGSIKVKKVDDNDAPLSGASFVVTKVTDGREANVELEGGNGEYTFKSLLDSLWERLTSRGTEAQVKDAGDNKGCLTISGLPYGTYKVYEYSAPEGYKKVETPYEFTIDSQGKGNDAQFYPFKNSLIQGKVKFYKTGLDKNNNQVGLEGAVFHLYEYRKTNGEIDRTIEPIDHSTVTSDRNGLVEKAGLGVGTYYFVEEIPPAGYEIKTGTDGEPLKYEFSVTEADDNNYVSFESSMSPYGTEKAVENDQAKGIVKLFKADKADLTRGLDGAEFSLFEKGNESPVTTGLKSGSTYYYEEGSFNEATGEKEEGCLIIKGLGWGTYYLKETKAPEGYALDANKEYEFKVEAANTGKRLSGNELTDVVITQGTNKRELTVVNELILGKAQFTKKDSVTKQPIAGATFALYRENGTVVEGYGTETKDGVETGKLISDADGIVKTSKNLTKGRYYFKEISAPEGYLLNDADKAVKYGFEVTQGNMDETILATGDNIGAEEGIAYNRPIPGKAELFKYETVNGEKRGIPGAQFKLVKMGTILTFIKTKDEKEVYTSNEDGIISVEDLEWGDYYFEEVQPADGYKQSRNPITIPFTIGVGQLDFTGNNRLEAENEPYKGSLKLIKKGTDGTPLQGAEFTLYRGSYTDSSKNIVETGLTTDGHGEINVTGLDWGSYYFVETKAPTGYALPADADNHYEAEAITAQNVKDSVDDPIVVNVTNSQMHGNVILTKKDNNTPAMNLAGASFELYREKSGSETADTPVLLSGDKGVYAYTGTDSDTVSTLITDDENVNENNRGTLTVTGLTYGKYYFMETAAPEGYNINPEPVRFSIDRDMGSDELEHVNCIDSPVIASVTFTKTDTESTPNPIENAVFQLYKENGTNLLKIGEFNSDENGLVTAGGLSTGSYFFKEKSVPGDAYKFNKDSRILPFTITAADNGKVKQLGDNGVYQNERKEGRVELKKYYKEGTVEEVLPGAVFELRIMKGTTPDYDDSDGVIDERVGTTYTTGPEGTITVPGLKWNTSYYFREIEAPRGYSYDPDRTYPFSFNESNVKDTLQIKADNDRLPGRIEITKVDSVSTSTVLEGVRFELFKKDIVDGEEVRSAAGVKLTDGNGRAVFDGLSWGNYVLVEAAPKTGYVPCDEIEIPVPETDQSGNIKLDASNAIRIERTVQNSKIRGYVALTKVDKENNRETLSGVKFDLYSGKPGTDSATIVKENLITDENGKLSEVVNGQSKTSIGPLEYGDYFFMEKETKRGYKLNETPITFTISAETTEDKPITLTAENEKKTGTVKLIKQDQQSKAVLYGAEFELYAREPETPGEVISSLWKDEFKRGTYVTNSNGEIVVDNLKTGSYFFLETKAPLGYSMLGKDDSARMHEFEITTDQDGAVVTMDPVDNVRIPGAVKLVKTDEETKAPIEGARFELYRLRENGAEPDYDKTGSLDIKITDKYPGSDTFFTTNSDGEILVEGLEWGRYYFVETAPAKGYEEKKTVSDILTVSASNYNADKDEMTVSTAYVKNRKGYGYASLQKYFVAGEIDWSKDLLWGVACDVYKDSKVYSNGTWGADEFTNTNHPGTGTSGNGHRKDYCGELTKNVIILDENMKPSKMVHYGGAGTSDCVLYTGPDYNEVRDISTVNVGEYIYWTTHNRTFFHRGRVIRDVTDALRGKEYYPYSHEGKDLSGIRFRLVNKDTKTIIGEYTTDADGRITSDDIGPLPYGTYYFEEISIPQAATDAGYVKSDLTVEFDVNKNSTAENVDKKPIVYVNNSMDVHGGAAITKTDADDPSRKVVGVDFNVFRYENGQSSPVTKVSSDSNGIVKVENLPMGVYYFEEDETTANLAGYAADSEKYWFEITATDNNKKVTVYRGESLENAVETSEAPNNEIRGSIELKKYGTDKTLLPLATDTSNEGGAEFALYNSADPETPLYDSEQLKKTEGYVVNNGSSIIVSNLPWGTYYFKEVKAPAGYALPQDTGDNRKSTAVTINSENAAASAASPIVSTMENGALSVILSKQALGGAEELAGAQLELYHAGTDGKRTGEPITTWTSGGSPKTVNTGLEGGAQYVLHEAEAPTGYAKADDILFTVGIDGTITVAAGIEKSDNKITMRDRPLELAISKKIKGTGEKLAGARLMVSEKATGAAVDSWTSNGGDHSLGARLTAGTEYVLEELEAPAGYVKFKPVTFRVMDNGSIQVTDDSGLNSSPDNIDKVLTVYDMPINVRVSKTRLSGSSESWVEGAEFELYEVVNNVTKPNAIGQFTSIGTGSVALDKAVLGDNLLKVGGLYKLVEKKAAPGYLKADDLLFTVDDLDTTKATDMSGAYTQLVNVKDSIIKIIVSKRVENVEGELPGAKLQLKDSSNNVVADWISSDKPAVIVSAKLTPEEEADISRDHMLVYTNKKGEAADSESYILGEGTYTIHETEAPAGYSIASDINMVVSSETAPEPVIMKDKPLAIAFGKVDGLGDALSGATLQLLDSNKTVLAEWTSTGKSKIVTKGGAYDSSKPGVMGYDPAKYEPFTSEELKDGEIVLRRGNKYYLHEVEAPEGYVKANKDLEITVDNNDIISRAVQEVKLTNVANGDVSVPVTKIWTVPKDTRGIISDSFVYPSITVNLYRDSEVKGTIDREHPVASHTFRGGSDPELQFTFTEDENGKPLKELSPAGYRYTYKIEEVIPEADSENENDRQLLQYTVSYGTEGSGIIYNKIGSGSTSLTVKKSWKWYEGVEFAPESVTVVLQKDGVDLTGDQYSHTFSFGKDEKGTTKEFTFSGLPKYDTETGREFEYTVREEGAGTTFTNNITYSGGSERIANIVNTPKPLPFKISGTKRWIEPENHDITKRPEVTIELWRDGKPYRSTELNADGSFEFDNLYEYRFGYGNETTDNFELADGKKFTYELKESGSYKYDTVITYGAEGAAEFDGSLIGTDRVLEATVTNSIAQEYVSIGGKKLWQDGGNSNKRPEVTVKLYSKKGSEPEEEAAAFTIQNTGSEYKFTKLPKYYYEGDVAKTITYIVREVKTEALAGYTAVPSEYYIQYADGLAEYGNNNFTNTPTKLKISKIDSLTGNELTGATLELRRKEGNILTDRWISGGEPHYIEGLVPGVEYTLTEISAPAGYWLAEPQTITVTAQDMTSDVAGGEIRTVTMEDEPIIGDVELEKRDSDTRDPLNGAEFELYTLSGSKVSVKQIDTNGNYVYSQSDKDVLTTELTAPAGKLSVKNLPYGTYYFKETKAPAGYEKSEKHEIFSVSEATTSKAAVPEDSSERKKSKVTFTNDKKLGKVELRKIAGDTGNTERALEGAIFALYSKTPRNTAQAIASSLYENAYYEYGRYTTDKDGLIQVDKLPWDDYYFIELEAPEGYATNADTNYDPLVYVFEVNAESVDASIVQSVNEGRAIVDPRDEGTPTPTPVITDEPTDVPTDVPTNVPTDVPTQGPTDEPGPTPKAEGGTPTPVIRDNPEPTPAGGGGVTPAPTQPGGGVTPSPTQPSGGATPTPAGPMPVPPGGGGVSPVPVQPQGATPTPAVVITRTTPTPEPTRAAGEEPTPTPTTAPTATPVVYVTTVPTPGVTPVVTVTTVPEYATPTPEPGVTRAPTPEPIYEATPTPTREPAVLGERKIKPGSPVQGVLGVRSAPTQGVLGARVGPATGDAANIALWLIILGASIGAIVVIVVQANRKRKSSR